MKRPVESQVWALVGTLLVVVSISVSTSLYVSLYLVFFGASVFILGYALLLQRKEREIAKLRKAGQV